jgi:glyoxylate utilization-related uncharacterized protein
LIQNIFDHPPAPLSGEVTDDLLNYRNVQIKRIVSSDDLHETTFCQPEAEWVVLLEGYAEIMMANQKYSLHKGDYLFIPPSQEHTILSVQRNTLWLAIHICEKE